MTPKQVLKWTALAVVLYVTILFAAIMVIRDVNEAKQRCVNVPNHRIACYP